MIVNQRIKNINPANHYSNKLSCLPVSSFPYTPSLHVNAHLTVKTQEPSTEVQKKSGTGYTEAQPMALHWGNNGSQLNRGRQCPQSQLGEDITGIQYVETNIL